MIYEAVVQPRFLPPTPAGASFAARLSEVATWHFAVNQLIYVETSIPSFYFETRPGPENQARRNWTREWGEVATVTETVITALAVFNELENSLDLRRR